MPNKIGKEQEAEVNVNGTSFTVKGPVAELINFISAMVALIALVVVIAKVFK